MSLFGLAVARRFGLPLPLDELGNGFGRYRHADQEALNFRAALRTQRWRLLLRLDPFGDHVETEMPAHQQDRIDDGTCAESIVCCCTNDLSILILSNGKRWQITEAGITSAEVVERDADTLRLQVAECLQHLLIVTGPARLR